MLLKRSHENIWAAIIMMVVFAVCAARGQGTVFVPGLVHIDTGFENASPLWYEVMPDGIVRVHLMYDNERASINRAAGHVHFLIHGAAGASLTLEFANLDNIWNGKPGSIAKEMQTLVVSTNGRDWKSVHTQTIPTNRIQLSITMPGPQLYVARIEPYRITDLDHLLSSIRTNEAVGITSIGRTVAGRDLEIVRIGNQKAPFRVFLRARAHPWESGGNWVLEGLIRRLLDGSEESKKCLARYCVYLMPMANKDGVARGMTRFNLRGKDLNREWDKTADPLLAPENAALERWLESMKATPINLVLDLHNDANGQLHISRPSTPGLERYLARMGTLEELLRKNTWFTEGATKASFRNPGSLGDGWLERFGIDAVVHEFNCNWIAGLKEAPSAQHWQEYGAGMAKAFYEYFGRAKE